MLEYFSLKNYKNFKEKQTLNFCNKNNNPLPIISIFGENGSGKSNLLKALLFVKDFILRPIIAITPTSDIASEIFLRSFKLDNNFINEPSEFEIAFKINNKKYKYNFSCNNKEIVSEKLSIFGEKTKRYSFLYEREKDSIEFNKELEKKLGIDEKIEIKSKELNKYKNILYLTILWNERIDIAYDIYMFFAKKLFVVSSPFDNGISDGNLTIKKIKENQNNDKQKIINFLNSVNINIEDIEIEEKDKEIKQIDLFNNQIDNVKAKFNNVKFFRYNNNNELIEFDFNEESDGTKKLFNLIGDIINVLENGVIVAFDELDKSLHIKLLLFIINLFNDKNINKKGAQLIFTTHNTSLLSNRYKNSFSDEEIWIIDKKYSGESELYSLNDITGIRKELSRENLYLNGLLGGVPNTVEFNI